MSCALEAVAGGPGLVGPRLGGVAWTGTSRSAARKGQKSEWLYVMFAPHVLQPPSQI